MSELRYEAYTIQAADFEEESSLPSLGELGNVQQRARAELDEDDEVFVGYGFLRGCFPYRQQERYGRELRERSFDGYVLENEFLRAWFLPGLGGRLISLFDKEAGRELLFRNDVLRVGNLALRSAWFSGGVEWNASIIGHSPFTCAPLFAARTSLPDGTPVLRMYEYERRRGVTYQMDFFLPDGSRVLFARMRLVNENEEVVPTYWWSNIAVPEREDSRVVIPADEAYVDRGEGVRKEPVPVDATGADVTYPVRNPKAIDHFWKLRRGARRGRERLVRPPAARRDAVCRRPASGGKTRALLRSCSLAPNAWASYALSRLFLAEGDREAVRRAALTALSLCPDDPCAAPRCLGCLSEAGAFADVLSSFERLSPAIAALPRVRLHRIRALIEAGRPEEALEDLTRDGGLVVPDVREGEETTSALWILLWSRLLGVSEEEAERRKPVPAVFDFRMQG